MPLTPNNQGGGNSRVKITDSRKGLSYYTNSVLGSYSNTLYINAGYITNSVQTGYIYNETTTGFNVNDILVPGITYDPSTFYYIFICTLEDKSTVFYADTNQNFAHIPSEVATWAQIATILTTAGTPFIAPFTLNATTGLLSYSTNTGTSDPYGLENTFNYTVTGDVDGANQLIKFVPPNYTGYFRVATVAPAGSNICAALGLKGYTFGLVGSQPPLTAPVSSGSSNADSNFDNADGPIQVSDDSFIGYAYGSLTGGGGGAIQIISLGFYEPSITGYGNGGGSAYGSGNVTSIANSSTVGQLFMASDTSGRSIDVIPNYGYDTDLNSIVGPNFAIVAQNGAPVMQRTVANQQVYYNYPNYTQGSNDTQTNLLEIELEENTTLNLLAQITGVYNNGPGGNSSDCLFAFISIFYRNIDGVVSIIGTPQVNISKNGTAGSTWNVVYEASGNLAQINVEGSDNTTVDWWINANAFVTL